MSRSAASLLFEPRSIVVYGASADPQKLSGRPLDYLRRLGYAGELHVVNPYRDVVQGVRAFAEIAQVPGPVDLAIIVVPADRVPDAVEKCARAGIGAAIIFASGFSEASEGMGAQAQHRVAESAKTAGMRVLGPNCLGSFALGEKAFATFSTAFDTPGELPDAAIALVSQSGAVGTFTYSTMAAKSLGVRFFANTGNQVDISVVELLDALVDRADVQLLMGHLEAFPDPNDLARLAAHAAAASKPLLLLKSGRTETGKRAIAAHTGSQGGDDTRFDAVLREYGAIRATSMEEWADLALAFASSRRTCGPRLSVVTQSGGAGALTADAAVDEGLEVEPWSEASRNELAKLLPSFASTANPIDVTGAVLNDVGILDRALQFSCEATETDVVLVVLGNSDNVAPQLVQTCIRHHRMAQKPLFVAWVGGSGQAAHDLLTAGVPTYTEPARAVRVIGHLVRFWQQLDAAKGSFV